jgi:hypothetical protein
MRLEYLLRLNRTIPVIDFDDYPFVCGAGGNVPLLSAREQRTGI